MMSEKRRQKNKHEERAGQMCDGTPCTPPEQPFCSDQAVPPSTPPSLQAFSFKQTVHLISGQHARLHVYSWQQCVCGAREAAGGAGGAGEVARFRANADMKELVKKPSCECATSLGEMKPGGSGVEVVVHTNHIQVKAGAALEKQTPSVPHACSHTKSNSSGSNVTMMVTEDAEKKIIISTSEKTEQLSWRR